jgi:hypothetical protein
MRTVRLPGGDVTTRPPADGDTASEQHDLTFRGLDYCDACGARLGPRERLAGLCSACSKPTKRLRPRHERERDR